MNLISGNTNSRGEMTKQSISKMTSNISSMTNENSESIIEKRLDIIEEDISKLKSSVKIPQISEISCNALPDFGSYEYY